MLYNTLRLVAILAIFVLNGACTLKTAPPCLALWCLLRLLITSWVLREPPCVCRQALL
jgi:hypothetical protein